MKYGPPWTLIACVDLACGRVGENHAPGDLGESAARQGDSRWQWIGPALAIAGLRIGKEWIVGNVDPNRVACVDGATVVDVIVHDVWPSRLHRAQVELPPVGVAEDNATTRYKAAHRVTEDQGYRVGFGLAVVVGNVGDDGG